jgi:hypothetical protein
VPGGEFHGSGGRAVPDCVRPMASRVRRHRGTDGAEARNLTTIRPALDKHGGESNDCPWQLAPSGLGS